MESSPAHNTQLKIPFASLATLKLPQIANLKSSTCYSHFGVFDLSRLAREACEAVQNNSGVDVTALQQTLTAFLTITRDDYHRYERNPLEKIEQLVACWFCIRMTKPTLEYTNAPRWHRDGRMFPSDTDAIVNSKYAITLLGNPTRFLEESNLVKDVMKGNQVEQRAKFAELLQGEKEVEIGTGQIARFSWGQDDSPVHSEPDMNTDRIFVSILYGSEQDIRNMCEWREEEYRE
ncbi:hypothetical protein B0O99DRAFT_621170 [Bisporella sp. PMI_857]|nr:hypothetical protein B0O99DRAFT_621170 [Bisporella sp. PMI_857]